MSLNIGASTKYTEEWFKLMANHFIGLKATLFAYSPGFSDLYIAFHKEDRYFLLKFSQTTYVKVHGEWIFGGLKVELEKEATTYHPRYKFFDQNHFEVICALFAVVEIENGHDLIGI